jgi:hypothetical protein
MGLQYKSVLAKLNKVGIFEEAPFFLFLLNNDFAGVKTLEWLALQFVYMTRRSDGQPH